ncbi:MAG: putative rane protein, partial [Dehalococcoidia bacterium]|nr:putative rane protein [Dehalococcoidia bacterium]
PYLAYNHSSTGNILPSTFYAKNVFYAKGLGLEHLPQYILGIITALAPGPLLALLPGVMGVVFLSSLGRIRGKRGTELANAPFLWALTLPLGWVVLLFVMYFVWLPAPNIHHGRYLMPSIPILLLGGAAATARLLEHPTFIRWRRPIMEYVAIFTLAWWVIGAVIYSCNVKFINDQQVATALWLKANTSQGTVVATHDIGAIGYFSERAVLDTVGLITPELTYRPGEPEAVISLMRERGATYMAAFPSWHHWTLDDSRFQQIVEASHRCFITSSPENMLIFRIAW